MSKQITVEGKTFNSIKEACKYYNLEYNTVYDRLNRGWSIEETFELKERIIEINWFNRKEITVEGKTFKSIEEACRYFNLNRSTVNVRLNKGWSIEEAFELIERNNTCKMITVEGKTFKSIKEASEFYNLDYSTIQRRLRNDWTIEEAFELVERKPITIEGKTFKSLTEACKYYNLEYNTIYARLNQLGWSVEKAFNINKQYISKEITIEGKTFKSVKEACKYFDLKKEYHIIINRLNSGWSVEDAFNVYIEMNYKNGKSIVIDDNSFISIKEACDYYDLDYDKVRSRLNNGWTIEEAFEFVERDDSCRSVNLEGKHFNSIKEACKYYNKDYKKTIDRLYKGWSIEEAFELVKRNNSCKSITIEGKHFNSIKEACKYYNIKYNTVYDRLNRGWSVEEAFELVPRQKKKK